MTAPKLFNDSVNSLITEECDLKKLQTESLFKIAFKTIQTLRASINLHKKGNDGDCQHLLRSDWSLVTLRFGGK